MTRALAAVMPTNLTATACACDDPALALLACVDTLDVYECRACGSVEIVETEVRSASD